ncbi:serine protease [Streptomyces kurssanovii]|uniref:Serine protease n=1 Tax=Streptomyces kurssanovii TaxID=67312 RepID=A0ABV3I1T7_9ACTN
MGRADLATLVRICDPAGRPHGTGFLADDLGTVVTGHDVVHGLARPVVLPLDGGGPAVEADSVTPLPGSGLALVHTSGLRVVPLPIGARERVEPGTYVRLAAGGWREARVLAAAHGVLELAIGTDGSDALRLVGGATGGPVLDAATGAVLGVLAAPPPPGTATAAVLVHPLGTARSEPHAALLRRNGALAPAYGPDLNLAAVLELTATSLAQAACPDAWPEPVPRPEVAEEFAAFTAHHGAAVVLGLVGAPGTGRTTELRALAARRAQGPRPAPTLWLRGADVRASDASLADAAARTLRGAARIVAVPEHADGRERGASPDRVARLAAEAGRPLLVVLDGPEEMPPAMATALPGWTASTAAWLAASGTRLVVACRPEHWEQAGALYPPHLLHRPVGGPTRWPAGAARTQTEGIPAGPVRGQARMHGAAAARGVHGAHGVREAQAAHAEQGAQGAHVVRGPAVRAEHGQQAAQAADAAHAEQAAQGAHVVQGPAARAAQGQHATQAADAAHAAPAVQAAHATPVHAAHATVAADAAHTAWAAHAAPLIGDEPERRVPAPRSPHAPPPSPAAGPGCPHPRVRDPQPPPAVRLGDLNPEQARAARQSYGLGPGSVAAEDERHPLVLRLLSEVHRALPGAVPGTPGRDDVFGAYLDLLCLRIAVRITAAAGSPPRGTAVRRLATRVAGRVHEAARRCLGTGHGQLDRASFEELFPWAGGWASAALTETLFVPAGSGYRFAHEELADWIQGAHLDVDAALHSLVHRREQHGPGEDGPPPVPRHRIGPVSEALLRLGRERGAHRLAHRLAGLAEVAQDDAHGRRDPDARWWAVRLLHEVLGRVPDAEPCLAVLQRLAERPGDDFGPAFWAGLRLADPARFDLLRRLVPGDPSPPSGTTPHFLELADARLAAAPAAVQPLLCRWFDDDTPLTAGPGATVRPTVGAAAQALLYARRDLAADDLAEALADTSHPRAAELLRALAEDEPSAMCRAVDRWARDPRPGRRAAAAHFGPLIAAAAMSDTDRELLRRAARALLAGTRGAHGPALTLLVRDPLSRERHLPRALELFAAGDPCLPVDALADALTTHPGPVLAAFRSRLLRPGTSARAGETLAALADAATSAVARRAAALVCEYVDHRPDGAVHAAAYLHHRLEHGPDGRDVLFPLVTHLVRGRPARVRGALAPVLAAGGAPASRPLRAELLEVLLRYEQYEARDLTVLDDLLCAAAHGCGTREEQRTRSLVHRTGLLLVRTPKGAACFDRRLTELAREVPGFAVLMARWPVADPKQWAAVEACRALGIRGSPVPMPTRAAGHGSLRPA